MHWLNKSGLVTLLKYKPVSFQLFILQLAGLGGFIHADIVNIAVWFISLILLCYGLAFVARLSCYPFVTMAVLAVLFAYLTFLPGEFRHPYVHVLSFCMAGLIGFCSQRTQHVIAMIACVIALLSIHFTPAAAYVAFTFFVMAIGIRLTNVPNAFTASQNQPMNTSLFMACALQPLAVICVAVGGLSRSGCYSHLAPRVMAQSFCAPWQASLKS